MVRFTRRQALGGLLGGIGLAAAASGCSRVSGPTTSGTASGAATTLQFGWWGNELRNAQTDEAVKLYVSQNPGVAIEQLPAEFGAYWDRLATQTAGNDAPDMIQMADGFISEYGGRGALLDLEPYVDVSKFAPGTVDVGRIDGTLVGINAGINTPVLMCNRGVWEEAGIELPDDTTWTWEDYRDIAAELTAATPSDVYGSTTPGSEGVLRAWLRQHGEELFTTEGTLGGSEENLLSYFELITSFADTQGIPPASQIVEDSAKPLEESPLAVGTAAIALIWSNQFSVMSQVASDEIAMLRMPTVTGRPEDMQAWYHPSMLWSASSRTEEPEAVGALIDWWVNSVECAEICLDERGRPVNTEVLEQITPSLSEEGQQISRFLADLEPYLGEPQPVPPPGSGQVLGDILSRAHDDLYFGRLTTAEATDRFITESEAALGQG
jgi:multiple sugar transport system substrate-binding protein